MINEEKKSKKPILVILIIVIVLGVVAALVLPSMLKNNKKDEPTEEKQPEKERDTMETDIHEISKEDLNAAIDSSETYTENVYNISNEEKVIGVIYSNEGGCYYESNITNKIYASKEWIFSDYLVHLGAGQGHYVVNDNHILITKYDENDKLTGINVYDIQEEKTLFKTNYDGYNNYSINETNAGTFVVATKNEGYKVINDKEEVLVSGYDYISETEVNGVFVVIKDNKIGLVKDGKEIVKPTFVYTPESKEDPYTPTNALCCGSEHTYSFTKITDDRYLLDIGYGGERYGALAYEAYLIYQDGSYKTLAYGKDLTGKGFNSITYDKDKNLIIATNSESDENYDEVVYSVVNYSPETGEIVK